MSDLLDPREELVLRPLVGGPLLYEAYVSILRARHSHTAQHLNPEHVPAPRLNLYFFVFKAKYWPVPGAERIATVQLLARHLLVDLDLSVGDDNQVMLADIHLNTPEERKLLAAIEGLKNY